MVAEVFSAMIQGIEGQIVKIQVDISNGLPNFNMIGYLSNEVKESKERVRIRFTSRITAIKAITVIHIPQFCTIPSVRSFNLSAMATSGFSRSLCCTRINRIK